MKITSKLFVFSLLLLSARSGFGQNDFFFNHYMFNPSYYNPAWVGTEDKAFAAAHHRTQWAGYNATFDPGGAPTTQLISLVVPMQSTLSGVGLSVSNDRVANLNSLQARLSISVKKDFRFGQLSLGLMPAINVQSIDPNFRPVDPNDGLIPTNKESQLKPNLHAGIFFKSRNDHFVGVSAENILQPGFDFGTDAENVIPVNYILMGGTSMGFTRDLVLNPTIMVRSDLNAYTFDLSAIAVYQDKMWGGLAFRRSESLSLLLGYSFLEGNKLKAGYSFDYVVKDQDAKEPTSHEIFLRYDLPNLILGGRKAVKTPRFTF